MLCLLCLLCVSRELFQQIHSVAAATGAANGPTGNNAVVKQGLPAMRCCPSRFISLNPLPPAGGRAAALCASGIPRPHSGALLLVQFTGHHRKLWCAAVGAIHRASLEQQRRFTENVGAAAVSVCWAACQVRKGFPAMLVPTCSGANCQCRHAQTVAVVHAAQEADALVGQRAVPSMKNAAVDAFKKLTLQVWQRVLTELHFLELRAVCSSNAWWQPTH